MDICLILCNWTSLFLKNKSNTAGELLRMSKTHIHPGMAQQVPTPCATPGNEWKRLSQAGRVHRKQVLRSHVQS